jgi:hypothetical protein
MRFSNIFYSFFQKNRVSLASCGSAVNRYVPTKPLIYFVGLVFALVLFSKPVMAQDIEVVGSSTFNAGNVNSTSIVLNRPADVEPGDFMMVFLSRRSDTSPTVVPAGWNLIVSAANGGNVRNSVYGKFATDSEPANYTFTYSGGVRSLGSLVAYRNVNSYDQISVTGTNTGSVNGDNNLIAPSVNSTTQDGLLIGFWASRTNVDQTDVTVQASMTERAEGIISGTRLVALVADQPITATGNTGTRTAGYTPISTNNQSYVAISIVLRAAVNLYAYQSGDWNTLNNWTRDPSGTTLNRPKVPGQFDEVTILNGRNITRSTNNATISKLVIQNGGFLNVGSTTGHNFGTIGGQGRLQLSSVTIPSGDFTEFVSANGGTFEFFNNGGTLPTGLTEYNNLILRNSSASNITFTLATNYTLNGSFTLTRTSTGTLTFQHGNSTVARNLTILGNATIGAGTSWTVFNGNQQNHNALIAGDFLNNGTVRFTNQGAPNYTAATTTGAVLLTMNGNRNSDMTLNGTTDIYRLILDKGIDQTFILSVTASNTANFRLFGPNNQTDSGNPPNIVEARALSLLTGTIRLGQNIVIPSLVNGNNNGFRIDEDVKLWLDGAQVTVSDNPTGNSPAAVVPYGTLRISSNSVFTDNSNQGIVTREKAVILIDGGTTTTVCVRTSFSDGVQRGAFTMTGGTLTIDGTLPTGLTGMEVYAPFFQPYPDNTFTMSGGTINILNSSPLPGGSGTNFSMVVGANPDNINVTGGTINITVPATRPAFFVSTAPFWNLNIISSSSANSAQPRTYLATTPTYLTVPFDIPAQDVRVLNDLSIQSNGVLTSGANNKNVFVGRNFNIASTATYTPGTNITGFNGAGKQFFTIDGTITTGLRDFAIDKSADTLRLAGSASSLLVLNDMNLAAGVLDDNGKTIEVRAGLTASGIHRGTGKILLTTLTTRTISGNGNGVLGNLDLSGPASAVTITLNAALRINGNLNFVPNGANNRILDIGANALTLGPSAVITNASGPSAPIRMIRTNGLQSAGGLTRIMNSTTAVFPIGTGAGNVYTPATFTLSQAPTTYGSITVRPVVAEHPNVTETGRSLTYYWRVTSSGFTLGPALVSSSFSYAQANVVAGGNVTENEYVPGRYDPLSASWVSSTASDVDETTNVINFSGPTFQAVIDGEYTAGDNDPLNPFGPVQVFYSYTNGNWENVNTWSLDGHTGTQNVPSSIPLANSVVRIGNGNTITVTANNAVAGSLQVAEGSTIDLVSTTGHNFGSLVGQMVTGVGRLRISSSTATAQFPAGDFSEFISPMGGIVEYYRTTTDFTLPTTSAAPSSIPLNAYRNLVLNVETGGTGIITLPAINLEIFEDVTIQGISGSTVRPANTASGNLQINRDLLVQGSRFVFRFNTANSRTVNVTRNVVISAGAQIASANSTTDVIHLIQIGGSLTNNGTFNPHFSATRNTSLKFVGAANTSLTGSNGSAATTLYQLEIDKGNSPASILDLDVAGTATFSLTNNWLTLTNGTFRLSRASTITLSNTATPYTIPGTGGVSVNNASAEVNIALNGNNAADLILGGRLELLAGTVNVGTTGNFNQDIEYASAGLPEIVIAGGTLNVNGQIRRVVASAVGSLVWRQSGGNVLIRGQNGVNTNGKLEISGPSAVFEMSGGTITVLRGGSITVADVFLRPGSFAVTGGTILTAPGSAIGNQIFTIDAGVPLWNLTTEGFNGSNTATLNLQVNNLTVANDLTIAANATLGAGNLNISVGRNFVKNASGTFSRGTQTVFFTGTSGGLQGNFTTDSFFNLEVANSASLTLAAASPVVVVNDFTMRTGSTVTDGDNLIEVRRSLINRGVHVSSGLSSVFGIEMKGSALQTISGTGTYGNLIINNASGVELTDSIVVNRRLRLNSGILDIGSNLVVLGPNADVSGVFSSNRMLRSNGVLSDGGVRKAYASAGSFTFPVGVFGKYTPATINVSSTGSAGTVTMKPVNDRHPSNRDAADRQLNYYWNVVSTGFSSPVVTHTYNYLQSDVTGNESLYNTGRFVFPNWDPTGGIPGTVNITSNVITLSAVSYIAGDYTAGETSEFQAVDTYYSRNGLSYPINWNAASSWSILGHDGAPAAVPPVGVPVIINTGHTVRANGVNFLLAESVDLIGTAALDLEDTFGHNFGAVSGTGTIRIKATPSNQFIFPGGNYSSFVTRGTGGTVVFYDNVDGILPVQTQYNDVVMVGSSERTHANVNWVINGNLLLEQGIYTNIDYNRNVTLYGDWVNNAAATAYVPGTGTVILAGTDTNQQIRGDFSTSFGFLELNGSADKELLKPVTVERGMNFITGRMLLNDQIMTWKPNTTIGGTPADSTFIVINDTGSLRREIGTVGTLVFPVGDTLTTADYTPATITFNSGTFGSGAYVQTRVVNTADLNCASSNFVRRFWVVEMSAISDFTGTGQFVYANGDVVGDESLIRTLSRDILDTICNLGTFANAITNTLSLPLTSTGFVVTGGDGSGLTPPTQQPVDLTFVTVTATGIELSWTNGNGDARLVLTKEGSAVDGLPVDNTVYTADNNLQGSPAEIGSGNFVVYNGSSNSVNVVGLDPKTRYFFNLFEYNESGAVISYQTTNPLTGDTLTMARFEISFTGDRGWRMMALPLTNTPYSNVFVDAATTGLITQGFPGSTSPGDSPNLLWYEESFKGTDNQRWRQPGNLSNNVVPGRGYMYYVFGDVASDSRYNVPLPMTISVDGYEPALTGAFNYNVSYSDTGDVGWNLIGNPYDDAIDWDAPTGWNRTNIDDGIYVWDPNFAGGPQYRVWSDGSGDTGLSGVIGRGQAFWIKANDEGAVLESTRAVIKDTLSFFGKELAADAEASDRARTVRSEHPTIEMRIFKGGRYQSAWLTFREESVRGKDRRDAYYLQPMTDSFVSIYTRIESENFAINALPRRFNAPLEIPVHIGGFESGNSVSGTYELSMGSLQHIPDSWSVELIDTRTNRRIMWKEAGQSEMRFDRQSVGQGLRQRMLPGTSDGQQSAGAVTRNTYDAAREDASAGENRSANRNATTGGDVRSEDAFDEQALHYPFDLTYDAPVTIAMPEPGEPIRMKSLSGTTQSRFVIRIDPNGEFSDLPAEVTLWQNYPNPFNPRTTIRFGLPLEERVRIEVYDVLGRRVTTIANDVYAAGVHMVEFNGQALASGVYFVRMSAGSVIHTRKMTLIK